MSDAAPTLPIIERRRIEAELLREVYITLTGMIGIEAAREAIRDSVRRSAMTQAAGFAERLPEGASLQGFVDIQRYWTAEDALTIEPVARSETRFDFNVTRCRYAEMYRDMGLADLGPLLSCNRDGAFCEGFDPRLKMTRTQTIMGGASHCDFRYQWVEGASDAPPDAG